jgi:hypothetical protein
MDYCWYAHALTIEWHLHMRKRANSHVTVNMITIPPLLGALEVFFGV